MKLISQPYHSKQCGQACLAMITGKTLEEVCNDLENYKSTIIKDEIIPYLNKNNFSTQTINSLSADFDSIPNNSIVYFMYQNGSTHVCVKHNDLYYDPDVGIIKEYDYKVRILKYIRFVKQ